MPVKTTLPPPTTQNSSLSKSDYGWLLLVQNLLPLVTVDTSKGNTVIFLPNAGVAATGLTGQNMEITYVKSSPDGNSVTVKGAISGTEVIAAQFESRKFKSDGTNWWVVA